MPADTLSLVASSQLALLASLASVVVTIVILAPRARAYGMAAVCGLVFGAGLWVAAREAPGPEGTGDADRLLLIGVGVLLALGVAAAFDGLLALPIPLVSRMRPVVRRALRPQRWGSAAEIGAASGLDPGIVSLLGVAVEARPITLEQLAVRARIAAHVAAASIIFLLLALDTFRAQVSAALGAKSLLLNALATVFVIFFLGPAQELLLQSMTSGEAVERPRTRKGPVVLAQTLVTFIVLVIFQSLQNAVQSGTGKMAFTEWILVAELCVLPVLVTTYYFGAALFREELGEIRWTRALEATLVAGAIVFVPFTLSEVLPRLLPQGLVGTIVNGVLAPGSGTTGLVLTGMLLAYVAVLLAMAAALVASAATYGVYGLALALAMTDATAVTARRRVFVALVLAGVVAQVLTTAGAWLAGVSVPGLSVVHVLLATGWGLGLVLSGFHDEMTADARGE
jgi:hypothetical protein